MYESVFNFGGVNTFINPFNKQSGELLLSVNVDSEPAGAKRKRPGYVTYLNSIGGTIDSLWDWQRNNGTQFWTYAVSGGSIFYSQQGTGDWTICGNGTMTDNARVGNVDVQGTFMMIGDGTAATRHTTDGTSFTNTSAAPIASQFESYQNRIYALGTLALHYSTAGTPGNWTTDSTSIDLPGGGAPRGLMKVSDRIVATKTTEEMYRWDGYNLFDIATKLGPSSRYSVKKIEDYALYLNEKGVFGFNGDRPELLSNPIERQIYNDSGNGIAGGTFASAPAGEYKYNYYLSVGTVTDELTDETINDAIIKYDYQLNEFSNYRFANFPTAWHTYKDAGGVERLIFGDIVGQSYTFGGTATSDNGAAIEAQMIGFLHWNQPHIDKLFKRIWVFANPGCEGHVLVAPSNTFTRQKKKWLPVGQFVDGIAELEFPSDSEGKLLFWKFNESSTTTRFTLYGFVVEFDTIERP